MKWYRIFMREGEICILRERHMTDYADRYAVLLEGARPVGKSTFPSLTGCNGEKSA